MIHIDPTHIIESVSRKNGIIVLVIIYVNPYPAL